MTVEMMPIVNVFGLENCYVTLDGDIFKRVPTKKTKTGIETIKRNFKTYRVMDLAYTAFGIDKQQETKIEDEIIETDSNI